MQWHWHGRTFGFGLLHLHFPWIFCSNEKDLLRRTKIANKMRGKQKAPEFPVEPMTRPPIPGPN
jgi:hypothetical protein